jgi:tetratricopeptide (TPR) repeat protein
MLNLTMTDGMPSVYLGALVAILGAASWFIVREVLRSRREEMALSRLQNTVNEGNATAIEYYELGTLLLRKKLYSQSMAQFLKASKAKDLGDGELPALVYNALGFCYAAKEQYDLAIKQYKEALKQEPGYVTALNNLGFAYERKQLLGPALETYDKALIYDSSNSIALKRSELLRKQLSPSS